MHTLQAEFLMCRGLEACGMSRQMEWVIVITVSSAQNNTGRRA